VRFGSRLDRPDVLIVRGGLFGNRVIAVPVAEAIDVLPRQQRIVISAREARQRHERLARRRAYLAATLGGG
jgi:hypothetical protein